jgi:hypothetical protein
MTPEDQQRLKAHLKEVAEILYKNTESTELSIFESIEKSLRQQILKEVGSLDREHLNYAININTYNPPMQELCKM